MQAPGMSEDELSLIKSYLLLLFIQKVFERDFKIITESGVFKTPQLYSELLFNAARQTSILFAEVKREITKRNMKIIDVHQKESGVEATYSCRGYVGDFCILWPAFRNEMLIRMRAYLGLHAPAE